MSRTLERPPTGPGSGRRRLLRRRPALDRSRLAAGVPLRPRRFARWPRWPRPHLRRPGGRLRPRLPRSRREALRWAGVVLVLLVAQQLHAARADLQGTRGRLDDARVELDGLRTDADRAHQRNELARRTVELVRSETDFAIATRTWIEAAIDTVVAQIEEVERAQQETDDARALVDADAAETRACFDGVARAVDANARGDEQAAVAVLRAASGACTRTLAYATGAEFPYDFADPHVLRVGGTWYGYSTNAGAGDVQVVRSTDLTHWELVGNALAALPRWADANATWAPSVLARGDHYVLYYTVREASSGLQCISRAVSPSPTGPFLDDSAGPLVCQRDHGGSIDPSPFVGPDGKATLLWKSEGRGFAGAPATIWSQELAPDGLSLAYVPPQALLTAGRSFERGVIEGPTMLHAGGRYFLLYAAADWSSPHYATGYAVCDGPAGPCTKTGGPVLQTVGRLAGPGGAEVFYDRQGRPWVAFHAYAEPNVGYPSSRYLHLARVAVTGTRLTIDLG